MYRFRSFFFLFFLLPLFLFFYEFLSRLFPENPIRKMSTNLYITFVSICTDSLPFSDRFPLLSPPRNTILLFANVSQIYIHFRRISIRYFNTNLYRFPTENYRLYTQFPRKLVKKKGVDHFPYAKCLQIFIQRSSKTVKIHCHFMIPYRFSLLLQ